MSKKFKTKNKIPKVSIGDRGGNMRSSGFVHSERLFIESERDEEGQLGGAKVGKECWAPGAEVSDSE